MSRLENLPSHCSLAKLLFSFTLGWPAYLFFNVSGRPYDKAWVNHFDPWSPIFRWAGRAVLSGREGKLFGCRVVLWCPTASGPLLPLEPQARCDLGCTKGQDAACGAATRQACGGTWRQTTDTHETKRLPFASLLQQAGAGRDCGV